MDRWEPSKKKTNTPPHRRCPGKSEQTNLIKKKISFLTHSNLFFSEILTQSTMSKSTDGKAVLINGINKTAILARKKHMEDDPDLDEHIPFTIKAYWEKGVVYKVGKSAVCYPPPEITKGEVRYPTMNSFYPLSSIGWFGLSFMTEAAERDMQFESCELEMSADMNLSCFYKLSTDDLSPFPHGVKMDAKVKGHQAENDLKRLTKLAEERCPSVKLMARAFPVEVMMEGKEVEIPENEPIYYDMDKYNKIAKQKGPHIIKQKIKGNWFCHNECKDYPNAAAKFVFEEEGGSVLPLSLEGTDSARNYLTPVQACFFGGLAQHMHTIAARIYAAGYRIKSIKGSIATEMNERSLMAMHSKRWVFPNGGTMELKIESDAPDGVIDQIQFEAEHMSPAFMIWMNSVPVQVSCSKKH